MMIGMDIKQTVSEGVPDRYREQAKAMLPFVDQALAKFGRTPVYREFVLTRTPEGAIIFFVVLEDRQLPDPIHLYEDKRLLSEMQTALRGRPVAFLTIPVSAMRFCSLARSSQRNPFPELSGE